MALFTPMISYGYDLRAQAQAIHMAVARDVSRQFEERDMAIRQAFEIQYAVGMARERQRAEMRMIAGAIATDIQSVSRPAHVEPVIAPLVERLGMIRKTGEHQHPSIRQTVTAPVYGTGTVTEEETSQIASKLFEERNRFIKLMQESARVEKKEEVTEKTVDMRQKQFAPVLEQIEMRLSTADITTRVGKKHKTQFIPCHKRADIKHGVHALPCDVPDDAVIISGITLKEVGKGPQKWGKMSDAPVGHKLHGKPYHGIEHDTLTNEYYIHRETGIKK